MKTKRILVALLALGTFCSVNAQTWLGSTLQFPDVNSGPNANGLTWFSQNPLLYGIYRTSGNWTAPTYQQLKLAWTTGIIIDGGFRTDYAFSGTQIQPSGGQVIIGSKTTVSVPTQLSIYGNTTIGTPTTQGSLSINGSLKTTGIATLGATTTSSLTINGNVISTGTLKIGSSSLATPVGYNLYVENGILTEKVKVAVKNSSDWSDFVFAKNYKLKPLSTVESFINENKHLPDVPSASSVVKTGIDVAKMDAILLQKIEELTLYIIQQQKEINALKVLSN